MPICALPLFHKGGPLLPNLEKKIGSLFILGFSGRHPLDPSVQLLSQQIKKHHLGGVILFSYNIENPTQLIQLNTHLQNESPEKNLIISVDQEGGFVQRLSPKKGFHGFLPPEDVSHLPPFAEKEHNDTLISELKRVRFNLDFAPCVDLNPIDYLSPIIGKIKRAYGHSVDSVTRHAEAFINAAHDHSIFTCIKHFPGHGSAHADSHEELPDVSKYWTEKELLPFFHLAKKPNLVDMVMTGHLFNSQLDADHPATFSRKTLSKLREIGYDGVIITDDLHMSAIQNHYTFKQSVLHAFKAGNDMVIFSNNPAAAKGTPDFLPDPHLAEKFIAVVLEAVQSGELLETDLLKSYERVCALKSRIKKTSTP